MLENFLEEIILFVVTTLMVAVTSFFLKLNNSLIQIKGSMKHTCQRLDEHVESSDTDTTKLLDHEKRIAITEEKIKVIQDNQNNFVKDIKDKFESLEKKLDNYLSIMIKNFNNTEDKN